MTKSEKERLDYLESRIIHIEKRVNFHDISYSQVIGQNTQIEFLKSKTDATNRLLNVIKDGLSRFMDKQCIFNENVVKNIKPVKDKPSRSMIDAYWLNCFAWGLSGVAVTLVALRFGWVI